MKAYEQNARGTTRSWLAKLSAAAANTAPIDVSLYINLALFDNMTRTGFSVDSGAVRLGSKPRMMHLMDANFARIAATAHSMWPLLITSKLGLVKDEGKFDKMTYDMGLERENNPNVLKDVMKFFLDDFRSDHPRAFHDRRAVYADAQAVLVGGTDTLSALLTHCFYYLAKSPAIRSQLRQELAPAFGKSCPGEFAYKDICPLPFLDSVISETLRMHSPTCNNGPRVTTGNVIIDGQVIPKDTVVYVGIHSIHRSPRYFMHPDEWMPERWTSRPDLILDKRAYHPFLSGKSSCLGPFNCVGRRLALMVAKIVLSYTVTLYDFKYPDGQNASSFLSNCKNQLILKPGKLDCIFTELSLG
ncbi:hypothetical protein diail_6337 [Diaporthe ilicicola]|nr:hypothetical protein diail_6337 [Diaporthe ilicicola]